MDNQEQKRKIAIVTGGASGIGLAIATEFVKNNIETIVIGRDQDKLDKAKEQLGDLCETISFDLGKREAIPQLIQEISNRRGRIDILVNNAGINMKKEFCEVTDEDFDTVLHTNLKSVFSISREVAKVMIEAGGGSIINISSMASQYGIPKVIAYTASKTALDGMTRAMATELSPKGIRVNSIAPGFIATDMSAKALNNDPERKQKVISRTPIGHLGEPSDIGTTAVFLVSDAAKYITGVILPVDGGNSIGF
jgi:NAD(P)-dependent dehydrogenase (short-subunit alcohol dehydrogenase family)